MMKVTAHKRQPARGGQLPVRPGEMEPTLGG